MLKINTGLKVGDGVTIVLDNLNEIVGRYVSDDEKTLTISCMRLVAPSVHPQTQQMSIGLQPLVMTLDSGQNGNIVLPKDKILTYGTAVEGVDKRLREEDSGIQLGGA